MAVNVSWLGVSRGKAHTNFKLNTMIENTHELSNKHSNPNCAKPLLGDDFIFLTLNILLMKHLLISFFIYIFYCAIIFLTYSFYNVSFNISIWTEYSRYGFCLLGVCIGLIISVFYYFLNPNNN